MKVKYDPDPDSKVRGLSNPDLDPKQILSALQHWEQ
jgi:hypothetical protein